ncbi:hypothetical protein VitviT2T_004134 [Vitis vinifera]|uniref:Uncharacterized protein n=1 Tax=Vitis vinifera TaxID=29760 RepID=A0ABY9BPR5_VITVI|nr:hypothetical protein VitviT2T_004134 [Vitis vinifera]
MEAKKLVEDVEIETHNVYIVEREVADVLETSKLKLQEAIKQNEEEIQICAWELYALVDSVSKYKEHMASKISEMKSNLSETAGAVSDSYKGSLSAHNLPYGNNLAWVENGIKMSLGLTMEHGMDLKVQWKFVQ